MKAFTLFHVPDNNAGNFKAKCTDCSASVSTSNTWSQLGQHSKCRGHSPLSEAPSYSITLEHYEEHHGFFSALIDGPVHVVTISGLECKIDNYLITGCLSDEADPLSYWKCHASKYPSLANFDSGCLDHIDMCTC